MYKKRLELTIYDAVIVHIITHGSESSFITSDMKKIKIDFIQHELIEAVRNTENAALIKLIFYHGCRGESDYSINRAHANVSSNVITPEQFDKEYQFALRSIPPMQPHTNNRNSDNISHDSNIAIISGNIKER
eukprot:338702_1